MGEVVSMTVDGINEFVKSAAIVGTDLVLTKGNNDTITLGLVGGATQEDIDDAVAALIGGATPAALDTLNELAAALGDDENVVATLLADVAALETAIANFSATLDMDVVLGGVSSNLPVFVAATSAGGTGASRAVNVPAGIASGDLVILLASDSENGTLVGKFPAGFTILDEEVPTRTHAVAYKFATGSEGSTYTVNSANGTSTDLGVACLVYRYAGTPVHKGTTPNANTFPAATGVLANEIVLGLHGGAGNDYEGGAAPWIERIDDYYAVGLGVGILVVEHTAPSDGSYTPLMTGSNNGSSFSVVIPFSDPGSYTLDSTDAGKVVEMAGTGNINLTVPNDATEAIPVGSVIMLRKTGATGTITIQPQDGTVFINPSGAVLDEQWQTVILHKRAANQWHVSEWATPAQMTAVVANNQVASYQLVLADAGKVVELNNAAAMNLTVPANATVAFPIGTVIEIWQQGAGQVTVVAAGGVTIRSTEGKLKCYGQYSSMSLRKRATDEWVLVGDLVA